MSKRNAIILILLVFIIILAGLLWWYFLNKESIPQTNTTTNSPVTSLFGENTGETTQQEPEVLTTASGTLPVGETADLRQIYASPNSGFVIFTKNNEIKIRFVDRATGNVYETTPNSEEIIRITNTTIPQVEETVWNSNGNSLILRYLKSDNETIENFSGKIKISTSTTNSFIGEITGIFLPENAKEIAINPSGTKVFTLIEKQDNSGSYGITSNLEGSSKNQNFDSKISKWQVSWPKENIISFTTKPTYVNEGFLYFFNINTNSFEKIFGNVSGLTTLINKDASAFVYSKSLRNSISLNFFNIKNSNDKNLQIATITDKCVWSKTEKTVVYCAVPKNIPTGSYPDMWYQGLVSFSDNLWKIDTDSGATSMIYEISKEGNTNIDIMDIKISDDDKYITFTNRNDLTLWGLKIK